MRPEDMEIRAEAAREKRIAWVTEVVQRITAHGQTPTTVAVAARLRRGTSTARALLREAGWEYDRDSDGWRLP